MTLAATLSIASFFDNIELEDLSFNLVFPQEVTTAGGDIFAADLDDAYWEMQGTTILYPHDEAKRYIALINSRSGSMLSFLATDRSKQYPINDPTGSLIGVTVPKVGSITDLSNLAFTGFPANYAIKTGDLFSIKYDTSRYFLGMFCEDRTSGVGGALSTVAIAPPLPNAIVGGEDVTLIKPPAKFVIVPDSVHIETSGFLNSTISFTARSTAKQ
jgi:hypothetical protein